jgi:inner membrane protein
MDNLCHTLVGAALAETGLKRRTALGSATLMIAANFPDIDVIAVPFGHSLGIRRGITHGLPAQFLLPFVLTAIMIGWHRWRGRGEAPDPRGLLVLSAIGIFTHPLLDWMNTYGMRWLMPLDGRWWYGDTLFIVDPWILLALLAGVVISRRRERRSSPAARTPARVALGAVAVYIGLMVTLSRMTNEGARAALAAKGVTPDTLVVDPQFATAVTRGVTYLWQGSYHLATYRMLERELTEPWFSLPVNGDHPAIAEANRTPAGREYHSWARLPYYQVEEGRDTTWVLIGDARYTLNARSSWAAARIPVVRSQAP